MKKAARPEEQSGLSEPGHFTSELERARKNFADALAALNLSDAARLMLTAAAASAWANAARRAG